MASRLPSAWQHCLASCLLGKVIQSACRDLCEERQEYRLEFGQVGVVVPLVGLLEDQGKDTTLTSAQALAALAQADEVRTAIR